MAMNVKQMAVNSSTGDLEDLSSTNGAADVNPKPGTGQYMRRRSLSDVTTREKAEFPSGSNIKEVWVYCEAIGGTRKYSNITSTTADIATGPAKLVGIFVASASSTPTIKVWDNTAASTTVLVNTFTPVAGTYYDFGEVHAGTGISVTISGTVDCTVIYEKEVTGLIAIDSTSDANADARLTILDSGSEDAGFDKIKLGEWMRVYVSNTALSQGSLGGGRVDVKASDGTTNLLFEIVGM